jgi:hypothetical protein
MQKAKSTMRYFFLLTAYCMLPTAYWQLRTHDEQGLSRSQPRPCTLVDIRWKKAQKFSLFLTFRSVRRDPDVSGLDSQLLPCQVHPIRRVVFSNGQNTMWDVEPEILISNSAYCSLSQAIATSSAKVALEFKLSSFAGGPRAHGKAG